MKLSLDLLDGEMLAVRQVGDRLDFFLSFLFLRLSPNFQFHSDIFDHRIVMPQSEFSPEI